MRYVFLLAFTLAACGSSAASKWLPADEATARTEMQTQAALVDFCSNDGGCTGAQVKIVEQATRCNLGAMLVRHGADIGDAGAGCQK